jgi:hypothetical protein
MKDVSQRPSECVPVLDITIAFVSLGIHDFNFYQDYHKRRARIRQSGESLDPNRESPYLRRFIERFFRNNGHSSLRKIGL